MTTLEEIKKLVEEFGCLKGRCELEQRRDEKARKQEKPRMVIASLISGAALYLLGDYILGNRGFVLVLFFPPLAIFLVTLYSRIDAKMISPEEKFERSLEMNINEAYIQIRVVENAMQKLIFAHMSQIRFPSLVDSQEKIISEPEYTLSQYLQLSKILEDIDQMYGPDINSYPLRHYEIKRSFKNLRDELIKNSQTGIQL